MFKHVKKIQQRHLLKNGGSIYLSDCHTHDLVVAENQHQGDIDSSLTCSMAACTAIHNLSSVLFISPSLLIYIAIYLSVESEYKPFPLLEKQYTTTSVPK